MREVKLVLAGKEYIKLKPAVGDWLNNLGAAEKIEGKNLLIDKTAVEMVFELLASYLNAPIELLKSHDDLQELLTAYNIMEKTNLEVFAKSQEVWGKNAQTPEA